MCVGGGGLCGLSAVIYWPYNKGVSCKQSSRWYHVGQARLFCASEMAVCKYDHDFKRRFASPSQPQ